MHLFRNLLTWSLSCTWFQQAIGSLRAAPSPLLVLQPCSVQPTDEYIQPLGSAPLALAIAASW